VGPAEDFVAGVDLGLWGRALSIGSRLSGEILQWFDGRELRLARSFVFERVGGGGLLKFAELTGDVFEERWRSAYPDAPQGASGKELRRWLLEHHGLWSPNSGDSIPISDDAGEK
jgi:hypothetical protein